MVDRELVKADAYAQTFIGIELEKSAHRTEPTYAFKV